MLGKILTARIHGRACLWIQSWFRLVGWNFIWCIRRKLTCPRLINMYSHRRVQWTTWIRLLVREMLGYMVWRASLQHQSRTLLLRYEICMSSLSSLTPLSDRSALRSVPHPFFPERTWPPTRNDFITAFCCISRMLMRRRRLTNFSDGGISMKKCYCFNFWANGRLHRQIFPGYSSAQRAPAKDGARAIMKEKRALKKRALAEAEVLS